MNLPHLSRNPWVRHFLKATVSIGVVLYLIHVVDFQRLIEPMHKATVTGILAATFFVIIGVVALQALEIHFSMPKTRRIPVLGLCKINFALMFYVLFMPAGVTFVIRWDKYRRAGYGGYDSAALVGFHKILQLLIAGVVCALSLVAAHDVLGKYGSELAVVIGALMTLLTVALLALIYGHGTNQLLRLLSMLRLTSRTASNGWRAKLSNGLERVTTKLGQAFSTFAGLGSRNILLVIGFACLQHLFIVLSTWVVITMVAPEAPFLATAFVRSVVVILLTVPISVGGLGVRELAFFTLFPMFGVPAELALTASLILFGVQLIVSAIGALIEIGDWFKPRTVTGEKADAIIDRLN